MDHWSKAIAAVRNVGEVISRTAASAQELLRDQELRSKGIQTVITGAQSRLQGIQNGIALRAGKLSERLQDNRRHLQALLQSLEEKLNASQRAWQLQARKRDRVDVQFGRQVIADAPQEVRARLWYVLLENPHLAAPLKCQHPGPAANRLSDDEADDQLGLDGPAQTRGSVPGGPEPTGPSGGGGSVSGGRLAAAAAALGFGRSSTSTSFTSSPSAASLGGGGGRRDRSMSHGAAPAAVDTQQQQQRAGLGASPGPQYGRLSRAGTALEYGETGDSDGWELVSGVLGPADAGFTGTGPAALAAAQPEAVRIIMELLEALGPQPLDESGSDPVLVAQQAVLEAMLQVPWETGVGLPVGYPPDCRFAVLNEMTAGQEEVDDSILRDIHRTFPEHPYFGMESGQRSLFRVLKAYSVHDLEVAYCQGMAFMAGVLLMYVPEEIAFRLFCRLMDAEGPNLRRLYLPGLEPLKAELATFEQLLTWRLPELAAHLTEFGLPPVLYVSQWLMTLFATPFPPAFCARVIDVLLQDGHDRLLLRCSYAVIEALEKELLERHDFEALITYLKMEPVSWGLGRQRSIMERALTSPITDAEIEVARDAVAHKHYMAATAAVAAAEGGEVGAGAEAAAAGAAAAVQDLLGPSVPGHLASGGSVVNQRQLSLEHAVEAALTVAAAAAISAAAGGGGDKGGNADDDDGAAAAGTFGVVVAADAAAASTVRTGGCRGGDGDMISFDDERVQRGVGEAGTSAGSHGSGGSGSAHGRGHRHRTRRHGATSGGGAEEGGQQHQAGGHGERDAAAEVAAGPPAGLCTIEASSTQFACNASTAAKYGMSLSLMDDLDRHSAAAGTGGVGASGGAGTSGARTCTGKPSDLEYGEYGEMLMDAGLLLPELGTGLLPPASGQDVGIGAPPSPGGGAGGGGGHICGLGGLAAGDDAFGPYTCAPVLDGMAGLSLDAHQQHQHQQHRAHGTDLLLD